ncbi:uncharacterized protein TrAtP1_009698 [Trichoderma atroviride]|uniref:uncharacterized protein n=1 Tax=Hypocrea atroviridis TaxID=63577 RepID=UPI003323A5E1|nr:hypothetical protein TrAtP1_009698 [Trichoderma atroviride]
MRTTRRRHLWRVAQRTAPAKSASRALQIPAIHSTAVQLVAAPPLYSRRATVLAVSFVISTYLVAYLPSSSRPLLKSISRVSAVRIVLQQISLFSTMIAISPVLPMIFRLRQITIGQISAPNDGYKIPGPTAGTSVLLITLTNIRTQLAVDSQSPQLP